jgi:Na+/proline symporter
VTPLIGAYITGPFFQRLNAKSAFEYLELRFDSTTVRKFGMACYVLRNFIACSIFIYGPATSLSFFTNLNEKIAIAAIGLIGTFYTTIGGIKVQSE